MHRSTLTLVLAIASCGGQANETGNNRAAAGTEPEEVVDCNVLSDEASSSFNEALEGAEQCSTDSDCEPFPMPDACWAHCTETLAGIDEFQKDITLLVANECDQFETQGCVVVPVSCTPQGTLKGFKCQSGSCVPDREVP